MRLRKWVKSVLYLLVIISCLVIASDCDDTLLFFVSHVIACTVFLLSATALIRYN